MFFHYLGRLYQTNFLSILGLAAAMVRHANLLLPLALASPASYLGRYLRARPEIVEVIYGRFIAANWDASKKLRVAIGHIGTVAEMAGIIDLPSDEVERLID